MLNVKKKPQEQQKKCASLNQWYAVYRLETSHFYRDSPVDGQLVKIYRILLLEVCMSYPSYPF